MAPAPAAPGCLGRLNLILLLCLLLVILCFVMGYEAGYGVGFRAKTAWSWARAAGGGGAPPGPLDVLLPE